MFLVLFFFFSCAKDSIPSLDELSSQSQDFEAGTPVQNDLEEELGALNGDSSQPLAEEEEAVEEETDDLSSQQSSFLFDKPCESPAINNDFCNNNLKKVQFSCSFDYQTVKDLGGASVMHGDLEVFSGYRQVSGNNQNPVVVAFRDGQKVWCQDQMETAGDDGTGFGLFSDGEILLGAFSCTGHQGDKSQDFRRFAEQGWMSSYGSGGGSKISILAQINPDTGAVLRATFLSAILESGKSNSFTITNLERLEDGNIKLYAKTRWAPRRIDKKRMDCSQDPEDHYLILSPDLSTAVESYAKYCQ